MFSQSGQSFPHRPGGAVDVDRRERIPVRGRCAGLAVVERGEPLGGPFGDFRRHEEDSARREVFRKGRGRTARPSFPGGSRAPTPTGRFLRAAAASCPRRSRWPARRGRLFSSERLSAPQTATVAASSRSSARATRQARCMAGVAARLQEAAVAAAASARSVGAFRGGAACVRTATAPGLRRSRTRTRRCCAPPGRTRSRSGGSARPDSGTCPRSRAPVSAPAPGLPASRPRP